MPFQPCPLSYPERFYAAVAFAANPPEAAKSVGDETRLLLYALFQQATLGPCTVPKPWGWNVIENAKWNSWKQLADMPSMEAMRLYVRTLEEDNGDWWSLITEGDDSKAASLAEAAGAAAKSAFSGVQAVLAATASGQQPAAAASSHRLSTLGAPGDWAAVNCVGEAPRRRYEQATAIVGEKMYVIGGNTNGRLLADVHSMDLRSLAWTRVDATAGTTALPSSSAPNSPPPPPPPPQLPPIAGHVALTWQQTVLIAGGHTKDASTTFEIYSLDTATGAWSKLEPSGTKPSARGGHTATLLGQQLFVFGGEDRSRRALSDLHVLDLKTMTWSSPATTGAAPAARTGHAAAALGDMLFVFGGGSTIDCFSDLKVLDTRTLVWQAVSPAGAVPKPRAGCSSAVLEGVWYICGGGDGAGPRRELLSLRLGAPGSALRWEVVQEVAGKSSLAREGLSVVSVPSVPGGALLSFGGYDGKYHADVHCLRPRPAGAPAAAAQEAKAAPRAAASAPPASAGPSTPMKPSQAPAPHAGTPGKSSDYALDAAAAELAAAKEAAAAELTLMRRQLAATQSSLAETEKELGATRAALSSEQARALRAEAELAEARQKVAELESHLQEAAVAMKRAQASQPKQGSGLWGYLSGRADDEQAGQNGN